MSVQSADGIQRARVTVYLHCSSMLFFWGGAEPTHTQSFVRRGL